MECKKKVKTEDLKNPPPCSGMGAGVVGLFVVDFDGTLLRDDKTVSENDLHALAKLRARGIITVIATGRSIYSFKKIIAELVGNSQKESFPIDYVIFSTGAGIMEFPGYRILKKKSLAQEDVTIISGIIDTYDIDYMIHRAVPGTKYFIYKYCTDFNSDFASRLELYRDYGTILTPQNLAGFGEATEVLCIAPKDNGSEITVHLSAVFSEYSVIKATSPLDKQSIWIEIFAKDVSKSTAVAWLSRQIGVKQTEVCAVGNDFNDEDLLDWAGTSFLVANGPRLMQSKYKLVASNNEDGVAEAAVLWGAGVDENLSAPVE